MPVDSLPGSGTEVLIIGLLVVLLLGTRSTSSGSCSTTDTESSYDSPSASPTNHTPESLHSKTPSQFEALVADAWEAHDYETERFPESGAVDILAKKGDDTVAIEAKRYKPGNKVSNPAVKEVLADAMQTDADRAAIATSSSFTGPAKEEADGRNIELVNGDRLCKWLS